MTDITELAQSLKAAADREMIFRDGAETSEIWERNVTPENILALVEALEKAQRANAAQDDHINQMAKRIRRLEIKNTGIGQHINSLNRQIAGKTEIEQQQAVRIAELEREQEHLRVVGVMSEKAFHRLENRESRFIALWPRPEQNIGSPAQSPIDHGYRPDCECSGCQATARICAELAGNSPMWIGVDWAKGCEPGSSPVIPDGKSVTASTGIPVIPDGYVMVPKEPTPEILATITEAIRAMRGSAATYARVLAAAPQEVK